MNIPNRGEFLKGCEEFEKHEKRDAMYKVATFLISHFWGPLYMTGSYQKNESNRLAPLLLGTILPFRETL